MKNGQPRPAYTNTALGVLVLGLTLAGCATYDPANWAQPMAYWAPPAANPYAPPPQPQAPTYGASDVAFLGTEGTQQLLGMGQPGGQPGPAAPPSYPGIGGGHWVQKNIERGELILAEDGSPWAVQPIDRVTCFLWMPLENLVITTTDLGAPGYFYLLVNTDTEEAVRARFLGYR